MKQRGIYQITYEALHDLLKLDEKHEIIDIFASREDRSKQCIDVVISGPGMKEVQEGLSIPWVKRLMRE